MKGLLALLGGPWAWLLSAARAAGRWLLADWRNGPLTTLGLLVLLHWTIIDPRLRAGRDEAQAKYAAERKAHIQTMKDFVQASKAAEAVQATNLARVESEQTAITTRISHDYQARLADLHARAAAIAQRMHNQQAPVASGSPGAPAVPTASAATAGAAEASGDHGLPELSLRQRVVASEQALQLNALIDWVVSQAAIRNSPSQELR